MGDVFISYSRKDSSFVDQLIRDLENAGIEVWIDREDIRGGDRWRPAIVESIRNCQAFLLVLSPNSVASENVSKELSIAETHKRRIVPIAYQPCIIPAEMEYQLAELQWIDFSTLSYQSALGQLTQVLGKAHVQKPARPLQAGASKPAAPNGNTRQLQLAAVIGAVIVLAGAMFWFLRPQQTIDPGFSSPTPTASNSPQASPASSYNRNEAIRLTVDGVNAFYNEDNSRESVILFFNEAIKKDPTYADAYYYRGQVFVALKRIERAIADFQKALELELEPDQRQTTQEFLAGLQKPPVQTGSGSAPVPVPAATVPTVGATPPITGATPGRPLPGRIPTIVASRPMVPKVVVQSQVADLFSSDKGVRIQATTRLIIDQKQDAEVVSMAISSAQKQLSNKSGVINTLVYLENVPPPILKSKQKEVSEFLNAVRKTSPGSQTADHINKVEEALK
jgi:tetratricopeptide (TPR) repeat protein